MTVSWQEQLRPGTALRTLVQEATASLVAMNADRLEELVQCCIDLNRGSLDTSDRAEDTDLHLIAGEVRLLGQVLLETRANLIVLSRLHLLRMHEEFPLLTWQSDSKPRSHMRDHAAAGGLTYGDN